MRERHFLRSILFIVFVAGMVFPPVGANPVSEYAVPVIIIALFLISTMTALVIRTYPIYVAIVAAVVGLTVRVIRKVKSSGAEWSSKTRINPTKFFRSILRFCFNCFVLGIIVAGYEIEPSVFASTVLLAVFIYWSALAILRVTGLDADSTSSNTNSYIILIPAILIAISLISITSASIVIPRWFFIVLAVTAFLISTTISGKGRDILPGTARNLLGICFFSGLAICSGFIFELFNVPKPGSGGFTVVNRIQYIFDVEYDRLSDRLYFSTKKNPPFFGYINLMDAESGAVNVPIRMPRRIALFTSKNKTFIGGGGVKGFTNDLQYELESPESGTRWNSDDIENMDDRFLLISHEYSNEISLYDIETGKTRNLRLPGTAGLLWPYGVANSTGSRAFYVSSWGPISPFVHRVDKEDFRIIKKFNGFFNFGMCLDALHGKLYVARPLHRRLDVLDDESLETISTIPVEFGVREIECDPEGRLLFAQSFFRGIISVVNMDTGEIIRKLRPADTSRAISYDPDDRTLYAGTSSGIYAIDMKKVLSE